MSAAEVLVSTFKCCISEDPTPHPPRRRIDRSMIGDPMDFRHTGHIGTSDLNGSGDNQPKQQRVFGSEPPPQMNLEDLTLQMKSKGGYGELTRSVSQGRSYGELARSVSQDYYRRSSSVQARN